MSEETFLITTLTELVCVGGVTFEETEVLDYIEKSIKKNQPDYVISRDDKSYGLFCIIPSKLRSTRCIVIDAHCDKVQKKFIKPQIYSNEKHGSGKIIKATALDNRIGVSVLLSLIKYYKSADMNICCLFSTREEVGYLGCKDFATTIDLRKRNLNVEEVIALDVTFAKLKNDYFDPIFKMFSGNELEIARCVRETEMPIIGEGSCPYDQDSGMPLKMIRPLCNLAAFSKGYYKRSKVFFMCVPVVDMHKLESYASLEDVVKLFSNLKKRVNTFITVKLE